MRFVNKVVRLTGVSVASFYNFYRSRIKGWEKITFIRSLTDWGSKKHSVHRKIRIIMPEVLSNERMEEQLAPLRARVKEQGDKIQQMKANGAPEIDIKKEVIELKFRKKELEDLSLKLSPVEYFDRAKMNDLIKRRFFYDNSFSIYGGIAGQYDLGPISCDLVDNMLLEWHRHFVIQEDMLKVNCSILTPEPVLKASGHVDKFADYMVKDVKTGECFRLDHLIKQYFEKQLVDKKISQEQKAKMIHQLNTLDSLDMVQMNTILRDYDMKSPVTGSDLTDAMEFNLMFPISIGPSGVLKGYLRPETAQGIFVNFKRLLEYNQGRLPFACAQVGNAYRNEISPRSGLLRVREFTMAEIEHFCYPDDKSHPKFEQVAGDVMTLYSGCNQMNGEPAQQLTIGEAVRGLLPVKNLSSTKHLLVLDTYLSDHSYINGHEPTQADFSLFQKFKSCPMSYEHLARWYKHISTFTCEEQKTNKCRSNSFPLLCGDDTKGLVANETLGYYMVRIQQYLIKIGITPQKLRFRQHLGNEMAHYACDCWDAECLTSYGWIECVGCADRSAYDLTQHTSASGTKLIVERQLSEPRTIKVVVPVFNKGLIGKTFKKDAKDIQEKITNMSVDEIHILEKQLSEIGEYDLNGHKITKDMVTSIKQEVKTVYVEEIIPNVIEPSFGIGRVFYALLEHTFRIREDDEKRTYFALPAIISPVKVSILPLSSKSEFAPFIQQIVAPLKKNNIPLKVDDSSGSIGRRYARTDELSIPYGITIDFDTVNVTPHSVTLRERDSTEQIRLPIEDVSEIVLQLSVGKLCWKNVTDQYPKFIAQETK